MDRYKSSLHFLLDRKCRLLFKWLFNPGWDLCKTPDLSAVQSDSIAERADNIEIFSSVREVHHEEMRQRWGFAKVSVFKCTVHFYTQSLLCAVDKGWKFRTCIHKNYLINFNICEIYPSLTKFLADKFVCSKSFTKRWDQPNHANVRSTIQRLGRICQEI